MQIKKNSILVGITIAFVSLISAGLFFGNKILTDLWNNENTWTLGDKVALPFQSKQNFKITTSSVNGIVKVSIPFCILYKATEVNDSVIEYSCAEIPFSYLELTRRFPEKVKLNEDIKLTVDTSKDALPGKFLGYLRINENDIKSIGTDPVPVQIDLAIVFQKPLKNISNLIKHYNATKNNGKESYAGMKIEDWNVQKVRQYNEYTASERKQIINDWRIKAWKDVNEVLKTDEFLNLGSTKELVEKMAPMLANHSVYCPTASKSGECYSAYAMNAATNIMYYAYAADGLDKTKANKVADALRDRVVPFLYQYNEELAKYYETCDSETECTYFHRMEAYDYPMCPINEIGTKEMTFVKSLFMDYRFVTMTESYLNSEHPVSEILAEYQKYEKQLKDSGIRRNFAEETIPNMDKFCFLIVSGEQKIDKKAIDSLKNLYMSFMLGQITISEEDFLNNKKSVDDTVFDLVLQSSVLNPYAYSFVPQPYTGFSRLLSGVQLVDPGSDPDGYWSSINATLILLYLTAQSK